MVKSLLFLIPAFLLWTNQSRAVSLKISKEQMKLFDQGVVQKEEGDCKAKSIDQKTFREWLFGEAKALSKVEPSVGTSHQKEWIADSVTLRVGEEPVDSAWDSHSPGTYGKLNGQNIHNATEKDDKTLKAPLVEVGEGTLNDLADRKDLERKVWLVKQSGLIPSQVALTLEAKLHKALAIIIYGENKASLDEDTIPALPILRITEESATKIKSKIKNRETLAELTAHTEFPVDKPEEWIFVKKGVREIDLGIFADIHDCKAVAVQLGLLDWVSKIDLNLEGTVFEFSTHQNLSDAGQIISELTLDPSVFEVSKFLSQWIKADKNLSEIVDGKKVLKSAIAVTSTLQGLVDKEALITFKTQLKQLESAVKAKPDIAWRLKRLFENDDLSLLASDLKNLRQVHDYAQRGQWDKAVGQFQKIHNFEWASNVSAPTFIEYEKANHSERQVNPLLWTELQKGRNHLDGFVDAVEVEIDRLDQRLSDNFFKLHKSIENLDKI